MLTATCVSNDNLEWLLEVDKEYEVISWTKRSIEIKHKSRYFVLDKIRFDFDETSEIIQSDWVEIDGKFKHKWTVH